MDNGPLPLNDTNNINNINEPNNPSQPGIFSTPQQDQNPEPVQEKPKKKKSLLAAIIILIFILICGGGFSAFAVIKNQPDNVALDAAHKLFNSKNTTVSGNAEIVLSDAINSYIGIKSIRYDINAETSGVNYSSNIAINVNLTDGTMITLPKIGQIMLDNGVFYLKIDNLKTAYDAYRDQISDYLNSAIASRYRYVYMEKCSQEVSDTEDIDAMLKCYDTDVTLSPEDKTAIDADTESILGAIDEIVGYINGKWFEISVEDILNDDMMSWIGDYNRNAILEAYNCTVDKFDNFEEYSNELSGLYDKYPFVSITPAEDSFYDISLKSSELADYINSIPNTKLFNEFISCYGDPTTIASSDFNVQTEQIETVVKYLPNISAKMEGFLDHQLTELKISKEDTYFNINSDLNFSYSDDVNVSAPDTSTPIMELVHKVYDFTVEVQSGIYGNF